MQVQLDETKTQLAELRAMLAKQESRNQVPNNVCFSVQNNSSGSTSTLDALDTIKTITCCDLVLPYGDMNQKCARGMVFPYNDGFIHSLPLRENHLKVMIDNIDERYKAIPVLVMTNEVGTLEDVVGSVIQCQWIAIVLSKEQQSKASSQQQIQTTSARPSTAKVVMEKNMPNQKINKPRPIESRRDLLKTNLVVHVVADAGHLEAGAFSVTYEDYYRLLKKQTADLSIITTWQILLQLMLQKHMGKCAFLNPYKILRKVFERYEKNTSIPIVWKLTECNQAGVLECELSGHYVMNWIFDFVLNKQHGFPSRFGTLWNDKIAFEEKVLVTTVATWAREFLKNFMNDVVV
ncbi:unnamed protein product [Lactuca saligna]|uniref:DUF8039 domain-containing protein n=1 Tax=Lactuca saligna TaxID=75948 RepID=A0AA35ZC61_LACSI|nr:unnamed protein product [Lactuca saligna]